MVRCHRDGQARLHRCGDLQDDVEHRLGKLDAVPVGAGEPRPRLGGRTVAVAKRGQEVNDLAGVLVWQVCLVVEQFGSGGRGHERPPNDRDDRNARFARFYASRLLAAIRWRASRSPRVGDGAGHPAAGPDRKMRLTTTVLGQGGTTPTAGGVCDLGLSGWERGPGVVPREGITAGGEADGGRRAA